MTAWYDQAWRAVVEGREYGPAFRDYRELLAGSGVDPYREPVFDRVWVRRAPNRATTIYGLEFAGKTLDGEIHWDALSMAGARDHALGELADQLLHKAAPDTGAYDGFVAFAERWAASSGGDILTDWQRRFVEEVESGRPVDQIPRLPGARPWTGDVLRAFWEEKS